MGRAILAVIVGYLTMAALVMGLFPVGSGDDGTGTMELSLIPNGFLTDNSGRGHFSTDLDYPVLDGAYPFQDADLSDFGIMLDESAPVAFKARPFAIVSHCLDNSGHGVMFRDPENMAGTLDQPWFIFDPDDNDDG